MKIDKMGVYVLMSHLIITITIIAVYAYTLVTGTGDVTLQTILTVIIGYWFGSMGTNALRPGAQTNIQQANEVKVTAAEKDEKGA
jgi:uncharacterized membrane protein YfcA